MCGFKDRLFVISFLLSWVTECYTQFIAVYDCKADDVPIYVGDSFTFHLTDAFRRLALACKMTRCSVAIAVNFPWIPDIFKCQVWLTKKKSQCKIKYKCT